MIIPIVLVSLLFGVVAAAYITDPFSRVSIIKQPFVIEILNGAFKVINENHKINLRQEWWRQGFAYVKCVVHVLHSRYVHSPRSHSTTVEEIIADIHTLRFNPDKLLLTSGDHFSALYVRNLGVFYYPMLDTAIKSTERDWRNRQIVYLQTVAYALGVFQKRPIPVTTIVTTGPYAATCINIYAYPPDTVYGIFYALAALLGLEQATPAPSLTKPQHKLGTVMAAQLLMHEYRPTLKALYEHYKATVFDEKTGLIRADKHFSGAKDITRRNCAFYDNVIYWKTLDLASKLGVAQKDKKASSELKARILKTFWLPDHGYFLEDLSEDGVRHAHYSSDWLIVLSTGFLSPRHSRERKYFERSVAYVQAQGIDQPFAIKYQQETRAYRQFLPVRIAVASYGGDAVWSFWGMEYIKVLLLLYQATDNIDYCTAADYHIKAYEQAMTRDQGFPEVYDSSGKLLETRMYRSIRQTGWVIGFEQVRTMRAALKKGHIQA